MTTKEKALAYDKALQVLHKYDGANIMFSQALKEEMFPELKESEDEKIRKELICFLETEIPQCNARDKYITWLEKQGKLVDEYEDRLDRCACESFNKGYKAAIEHQKEKPADKVEPKFNVGDKIQFSKGCGTIMTIEKIENGEYVFANNMGHTTIEWGNKWYLADCNHA